MRLRKMILALLVIVCTFGATAQASYLPYDGTMSNTYVQYFKDILADKNFTDNYVAFRGGQYEYYMVVGSLSFDGNSIVLNEEGKLYSFSTSSNYGASYSYSVESITDFRLNLTDDIVYTDLGDYPQLIERSARLEEITLVVLGVFGLFTIVRRIFGR